MKTEQSDMWFFRKLYSLAIMGVIGFVCWFMLGRYQVWLKGSEVFQIRKIEISGNEFLSDTDILEIGKLNPKTHIWHVDLCKVDQALRNNPFIADVKINRLVPDILQIELKEKNPVALLNFNRKLYCIDREGLILPSKPGKLYDLPVLTGSFKGGVAMGKYAKGERVKEGLTFLFHVMAYQPELYAKISEVVVGRSDGLLIHTSENGIPVRLGEGDYLWKLRYLEAVLSQLTSQNGFKKVRYIDLRYKGQVVVGKRA